MNTLKPVKRGQNKSLVKDIVFAVTYQCNSRCKFCNIWQKSETFALTSADYNNIPRTVKDINISGGEPFLRPDLVEVIKTLNYRAPKARMVISTNGFTPSLIKKQMARIVKFKRDIGVAVSIDGYGLAHEKLRRVNGGFCLAVETIRLLKELGLKHIAIGFTLSDENIDQLKKVYRLAKTMDVDFSLTLVHNSDHFFATSANQIKKVEEMKKELTWLIDQEIRTMSPWKAARAYYTHGMIHFIETGERLLEDETGVSSIFVDPKGDIYPSDIFSLKMGNIQDVADWGKFSRNAQNTFLFTPRPASWMICTTRQVLWNNWFKASRWIAVNKLKYHWRHWQKRFSNQPFAKRAEKYSS